MKLSIIIPAYNASATIERTLNSIYEQNLLQDDFEVIIVDDCSTDDTVDIIEKYMKEHSNLVLLRQNENHRQGAARNIGIKHANGKYIHFVDADDWVLEGELEALKFIEEQDLDALFCDYQVFRNDKVEQRALNNFVDGVYLGIDFCEKFYDQYVSPVPWSYLWKTAFLRNSGIKFIEDRRMEDMDWIVKVLMLAHRTSCLHVNIYASDSRNTSSTTHTINSETLGDWLHWMFRYYEFIEIIKNQCPRFYKEQKNKIISTADNLFRIKALTKLGFHAVPRIMQRTGNKACLYLAQKNINIVVQLLVTRPYLLQLFVYLAWPYYIIERAINKLIRSIR